MILKFWDLPRYITLVGQHGEKKMYEIKRSTKRLGIALNAVEVLTQEEVRVRRSIRG